MSNASDGPKLTRAERAVFKALENQDRVNRDHGKTWFRIRDKTLAQKTGYGAGEELLDVVGSHDTVAKQPSPLVCLVHIADNLAKDFGLGYLPEERANYSATVLIALGLSKDDLEHVKVSIEPSLVAEIAELVNYCLQD